ncbi:SH3 domain-containing protein [Prunus dulcis]|uniref:SH3 domain-containing protein n=1 Tax=Prunus dulcis TaxID=3755 RepID=A0A4Y1RFP5_PRUDU|nr:SH3 domain-containing protein [Prunus dulcis]
MESIRKQASKLREQVAKQQQAVLKRLGSLGNEAVMIDEAELLCHQNLQDLYNSTRAAKRSLVRGVEAFVSISSKQMEIVRKLAEDCCKYGAENQSTSTPLVIASDYFGTSYNSIEEEREIFLKILGEQVAEPLRAQINRAPLEDARHLTHRYDKLRQEVEAQVAEVLRRRLKSRGSVSAESSVKLQNAEARLTELKSTTVALGREATAAMLSVEEHQQQMTFHKLCTMEKHLSRSSSRNISKCISRSTWNLDVLLVDAERSYHQHALAILDKLHSEMILEKLPKEFSSQSEKMDPDTNSNRSDDHGQLYQDDTFFIARAIHPFDAQADGELNLAIDDYVVVGPNGWSEGECNGKAGWFPSAYIERQEKAPSAKLML